MNQKEIAKAIRNVKLLKSDLEKLGAWTNLDIHNFGEVVEIRLTANWMREDAQDANGGEGG